jgi:hypothetical protein
MIFVELRVGLIELSFKHLNFLEDCLGDGRPHLRG